MAPRAASAGARPPDLFLLRDQLVLSLPSDAGLDSLTEAERDVAWLAVLGLSNAAIAARRRGSARTVANQLASIFRKLGVGSRAELASRVARALSEAT